jgi:hypothetical protein
MWPFKIRLINLSTMHSFEVMAWWNGATKLRTWLGDVDMATRRVPNSPHIIMTGYAAK